MDKRNIYLVLYVLLLTMTTPALCFKQRLEKQLSSKDAQESVALARQRRAALPIAAYAGMVVSPYIFAALVAAYGAYMVAQYGIRKASSGSSRNSHSCANNRGWCRSRCFSHEYVDWYHSDVCGSYKCCRS